MATSPFTTWTRTVIETRDIAKVTTENIHQIAAQVGGTVDYSAGGPVLIVSSGTSTWRITIGSTVSLLGDQLINQNGFNRAGDWHPVNSAEGI